MPNKSKLLFITAGCILTVAFTLFTASNVVPTWLTISDDRFGITVGLWQGCVTSSDVNRCDKFECPIANDDSGFCKKIVPARAFITIACILSGLSAICIYVCAILGDKVTRVVTIAAKVLVSTSLIMGIIGVALGISGTTDFIKGNLGAGAILGIIAIILNFFGSLVAILIK